MELILKKFVSIYSIWPMLLTVGIGMFAFFVDYRSLKEKENLKEAKWAKRIGLVYMIGGAGLFIFIKLLS
ncbi:CLC_0170 family protein [Defluviitalea saccharophila]|uniref:Uncharacterized protein n=1 Tax=Defluviitalea saccharophila TaxID=879970 RepID=A0ABZ2Y1B1_9FIRM|nr:hypothetical protein [Candidatus Epulonipiscium sp.]